MVILDTNVIIDYLMGKENIVNVKNGTFMHSVNF